MLLEKLLHFLERGRELPTFGAHLHHENPRQVIGIVIIDTKPPLETATKASVLIEKMLVHFISIACDDAD